MPTSQGLLSLAPVHRASRPSLRTRLNGPASHERIFDAFLAQCRRSPGAPALVEGDRVWSYAQLEEATRALALRLLERPATSDVVALYARRSPELVIAMVACLRAGLPFAVLDAAYPRERLEQLMTVARPGRFLVVGSARRDEETLARLPLPDVVLHVDGSEAGPTNASADLLDQVAPESIAYLLFTSGTTGVPKGIKTSHHPLVHFVAWYAKTFAADATGRFSMLSGLGHDPILRDVFVPLSVGARLHVPAPEVVFDPRALHAWFRASAVTHAHVTPQLGRILGAGGEGQPALDALRFVFSGGDVLRRKHALDLLAAAPSAQVVNFYGSTETPQAMAYHVFDAQADASFDVVPVGRGIDDVQVLVLDEHLAVAGLETRGQIAIRTKFLSEGYVGDASLTRERFVAHPKAKDETDRLYLTGDMGYFRADGAVVAEGRQDDQVKIRGFRVELGEVVHHLERTPAVTGAVVLAEKTPDGENRLVAYLVGAPGAAKGAAATAEVKEALATSLPAYMVPFQLVWMDAFPLLPNGKIDRKKLAESGGIARGSARPADGSVLAILAAKWSSLLGVDAVDPDRSFLELGGDSLSFIMAAMHLEALLGKLPEQWERLPLRELALQKRVGPSRFTRTDATVLARAICIVAIVAAHFGFPNLAGSTRALFVVSGMSFGKYLVSSVLRTNRVDAILKLAFKIALPTVLYTLVLNLAFLRTVKWPAMILINNFIDPHIEVSGYGFWFVNVLVQSQLVLAAFLAAKPVRELVRKDPYPVALGGSVAFALLAALLPRVWNTAPLFDHVPPMYLGAMCLGWAASQAHTQGRRLLVVLATLATFALPAWKSDEILAFPFLATFFLLYQRQVTLPLYVGRVVNLVAGSSLFIYLTDYQFKAIIGKTPLGHYPLVTLLLALVGGICLWKGWEALVAVVAKGPGRVAPSKESAVEA